MIYFKMTDEDGFVSVATMNADKGGNSTKEEHDAIAQMYVSAEAGYGVVETESGFVYAMRPVEPTDEEANAEDYENALADLGVKV